MKIKKIYALSFLLSLSYSFVAGQSIENTINLYGSNFPHEKVHVHFDKETYLPGETIWFKAYILEENLPSERSTNFYAALYDEKGNLLQVKTAPIFDASAESFFDLPDSVTYRQVICRAYTSWMRNFDSAFYFVKAIPVVNHNSVQVKNNSLSVAIQFFPEGGDIIEGTRNTIAFKSNYSNGIPYPLKGVLKNNQGDTVALLESVHDGMGRFDVEIEPGMLYFAEWRDNHGQMQKSALPMVKTSGVSFKVAQSNNRLIYNLVNKLPSDSLHILMYMYQAVVYKKNMKLLPGENFTGVVPVTALPNGTIVITVFDKDWKPVAERIAYIHNARNPVPVKLANLSINKSERGKSSFEVLLPDTIRANLSISITDAGFNNLPAEQTIETSFLLSGNVKGYIHQPSYYFKEDSSVLRQNHLDLVMLTHGWRRYNWQDLQARKMPEIKYPVDNYLSIHGQIDPGLLNKINKEEMLNIIIRTKDSNRYMYAAVPGKTGFLLQDGLVIYDSALVYFGFNKSKSLNPKVSLSSVHNSVRLPAFINNFSTYLLPDSMLLSSGKNADQFSYYRQKALLDAKVKTLETVTLKTKVKNRNALIQELNDRYTTGIFRGGASGDAYDVLHDETASSYLDVYDYLRSKSFNIGVSGGFMTRNFTSTRSEGGVIIFLNENRIDDNIAGTINMQDVAYIKIIQRYFAERSGNDYPTAIMIYTKKGQDAVSGSRMPQDFRVTSMVGYSPYKEFYSPDYSVSNTGPGTDARTTLLWKPFIMLDKTNPKEVITFYNNDITKKFRVILEGFNDQGKLIHLEQILE